MEHVAAYRAPDSKPGHWSNQEGRVPGAPGGVWVHLGPDLGLRGTSLQGRYAWALAMAKGTLPQDFCWIPDLLPRHRSAHRLKGLHDVAWPWSRGVLPVQGRKTGAARKTNTMREGF